MTRRKIVALVAFNLAAILTIAGLVALGTWQLHRRAWKLDRIARIESRVHAAPVTAPGPDRWPSISAATDEYRRVTVTGRWQEGASALVHAVSELGGGYWVLTPLFRDDGTTVFINRGFVPTDKKDPRFWKATNPETATVTGLLRVTEPSGAFLRSNDPDANRWFSRDVQAIAAWRGLLNVAPYFIDAQHMQGSDSLPVAGLTVLSFANNHLVYAVTWYGLALMVLGGAVFFNSDVVRTQRLQVAPPRSLQVRP